MIIQNDGDFVNLYGIKEKEDDENDTTATSSSSSGSENIAEDLPKNDIKPKKIRRATVNFS